MKTKAFVVLLALCIAGNLASQTPKQSVIASLVTKTGDMTTTGTLVIRGVQIRTLGSAFECEQQCDITDDRVRLTADKVIYDTGTGELSASGTVKMTFVGFVGTRR